MESDYTVSRLPVCPATKRWAQEKVNETRKEEKDKWRFSFNSSKSR